MLTAMLQVYTKKSVNALIQSNDYHHHHLDNPGNIGDVFGNLHYHWYQQQQNYLDIIYSKSISTSTITGRRLMFIRSMLNNITFIATLILVFIRSMSVAQSLTTPFDILNDYNHNNNDNNSIGDDLLFANNYSKQNNNSPKPLSDQHMECKDDFIGIVNFTYINFPG